ncbi:MAG: HAD family phosphatase [Rhodospirillales bacterium]|nr:HAD family phosphatase [Rhodospirillales bacterium]
MSRQPSTVLFDMGGVLFTYDAARRLRYISETCAIPESEIQARVFDTDFDHRCETGALDGPQSCLEFNRLCGTELTRNDFRTALTSAFEPNGIVFGIARELTRQCTLAGFTNNGHEIRAGLAALHPDLLPLFADRLVCSAEIGLLKPDPGAFQAVLTRLGRQPDEVLFVDDSEANVRAAAAMGFHIHRFFDAESLETDLRSFGLL